MELSRGHICQCLSKLLTSRRHAAVTITGDRRRTGEEFVDRVLGLARELGELGVKQGDVVAIVALNSEWYMEWLLAVAFVGGIVAPLNYRWSTDEARDAMEVVSPMMLVVDEECSKWTSTLKTSSLKFIAFMGEHPSFVGNNGNDNFHFKFRRLSKTTLCSFSYRHAPKDVALICFTSGTTGRPKGAAISHMSLIVQALAKIAVVDYNDDDVYLHTAPLCHIGGLSSCIAVLMSGGCHVFIPRFDAKLAIQAIEQSHVTSFITVPAMMADLITYTRQWDRWSCGESVKKVLNGGGGLTSRLVADATHLFPHAKIISAYGMTEACSSMTFMTLHDPTASDLQHASRSFDGHSTKLSLPNHLGGSCVGKAPAHIELQIQKNDTNNSGPVGIGRIITRGPHVMIGYWGLVSTESSLEDSHGWFDTGDVGWMDESGNLWLLGRKKDKIKSGGENIYPEEVESVILQHPGVSNVVVVGIPDYRLTEMVIACINLKEDWEWVDQPNVSSDGLKQISRATLQDFCRKRNITRYKIPKHFIIWREPFPRTSIGKLKRDRVRLEATNHLQFLQSSL